MKKEQLDVIKHVLKSLYKMRYQGDMPNDARNHINDDIILLQNLIDEDGMNEGIIRRDASLGHPGDGWYEVTTYEDAEKRQQRVFINTIIYDKYEIKPCHCGGKPILEYDTELYATIHCDKCGTHGFVFGENAIEMVIRKWNENEG